MELHAKIEAILRSELEQAIRYQDQRSRDYQEVLGHVSPDHSSREDADRVQEAVLQELAARNVTWRAAQRLSDFENFGWIPDDLGHSPELVNHSYA